LLRPARVGTAVGAHERVQRRPGTARVPVHPPQPGHPHPEPAVTPAQGHGIPRTLLRRRPPVGAATAATAGKHFLPRIYADYSDPVEAGPRPAGSSVAARPQPAWMKSPVQRAAPALASARSESSR